MIPGTSAAGTLSGVETSQGLQRTDSVRSTLRCARGHERNVTTSIHSDGAGEVEEWVGGELDRRIWPSSTTRWEASSAPAEVSAEFFAGVPLTTKLAPGSVWNRAASEGSLDPSRAPTTTAVRRVSAARHEQQQRSKRPAQLASGVGRDLRELKAERKPALVRSV